MKFKIGFDVSSKGKLYGYFDDIIANQRWSEGYYVKRFEEKWAEYCGVKYAVAFNSWFTAAIVTIDFFDCAHDGKEGKVGCPSNTFVATPMASINCGDSVVFFDCSRKDLCLSVDNLEWNQETYVRYKSLKMLWVVHIGGHIAFDIAKIAEKCAYDGIVLLEDCAHAHGASWDGKRAGSWGDAGIYSFAPTKTISTGEGGMLVTNNESLAEYAKLYRNYSKFNYLVEYAGNYKMNEFTAAIGCVQVDDLDRIVEWKNEYVEKNFSHLEGIEMPSGMVSGYYKFISFTPTQETTGRVYDQPCHRILNHRISLPDTDWVAQNHWCPPIYYRGDE